MIICIEISKRTKDELDSLLEVGKYRDYSEAVAVAIANQSLLHKQSGNASCNELDAELGQQDQERTRSARERHEFTTPLSERDAGLLITAIGYRKGSTVIRNGAGQVIGCVAHPEDIKDFLRAQNDSLRSVPSLFQLPAGGPPKLAALPKDVVFFDHIIPVDRWIFGQYNKLLPVKATCRALANILLRDAASRESGVPLEQAASEIAGEAAILGDFLRNLDSKSDIHRDDTFSFAFPCTNPRNGDKSRLRYASQFVGSLSKQGMLTGLPVELKLVNIDASRNARLALTEPGWRLAQLANPVLDGAGDQPLTRFTDDEVSFFIELICKHVPAEDFAYRAVLGAILGGANTPEKLDDALTPFLSKREVKPFTRAFLTTQRAGVVSRMIDLSLIQRVRDGIKATYTSTPKSSSFKPKLIHKVG